MFVLLSRDANPTNLIELLSNVGVYAVKENGGLYLKGDVFRIDVAWLRQRPEVEGVLSITSMAPLSERKNRSDTVVHVKNNAFGDGFFSVIAGPCAVESYNTISECADIVSRYGGNLLRGGAFKPRTSPYHYQGLGEEGLSFLYNVGKRNNIPVVAELMTPDDCEKYADYLDVVQIGARNMQNFPLLRAAGQLQKPVILKRGFCATQDEWLLAAEYILSAGNSDIILCERGIRTFESGQRFTLDLAAVAALKRKTHLPVIVDPSHAAGKAELVEPLALAAICAGADGLMVEVHPNPTDAMCDGLQALDEMQFAHLMGTAMSLHKYLLETK